MADVHRSNNKNNSTRTAAREALTARSDAACSPGLPEHPEAASRATRQL